MSLCAYCKAIPYHPLPSEDEPGLPHQPDLPALTRSAATCTLCELLLQSAYTTRSKIRQERCGGNDVPTGWTSTQTDTDGKTVITELGQYNPGSELFTPGPDASFRGLGYPGCSFVNDEWMKPWLYGSWWRRYPERSPSGGEDLQLIGISVRLGTSPRLEDGEGNSREESHLRGTCLRVRAVPGSGTTAQSFVPGRPRTASSRSGLALQQMQRWLAQCDQHRFCHTSTTTLPTRILQVSSSSRGLAVRLQETRGMAGKYTALSHCWGQQTPFTTTSTNIAARRVDIPISALPTTLRDAMELTHRLGLHYIWIDSLCIVQDDRADWQREAPRMAEVYSGAWVTFSASHSVGGHTGLYGPLNRPTPDETPENMSLGRFVQGNVGPFLADNAGPPGFSILARCPLAYVTSYSYRGIRSDLLISQDWMPTSTRRNPTQYISGGFGRPFDPLEKQHLQSRAWTLQERLLSKRIIHFAADQMYWECGACMVGEDGSQFSPEWYNMDLILHGQSLPHSECGQSFSGLSLIEGYAPSDTTKRGRWRGGWLKHVEDYSGRSLTHESDKLIAMSGVAKQIAAATSDQYYAGLWRSHILEDLCWRTYPVEEQRRHVPGGFAQTYGRRRCRITAAASYRAPSWSWATLNGAIKFLAVDYSRLVADVVACHVQPASAANPFGSAASGWLKIKGPLLPIWKASPDTGWDRKLPLGFGTLCEMHTPEGVSLGEVYLDLEESTASLSANGSSDVANALSSLAISGASPRLPVVQARQVRSPSRDRDTDQAPGYFGLFLDSAHCLLLRRRTASSQYERVGLGKFLRTKEQICPIDVKTYNVGVTTPLGPIQPSHERVEVTIV
ncbi:hypothetical protein LTR53_004620 [Teratosphaeriaceae sp. CCFEE 6253]|nr:hypothetical protein LTR53_004620 [Teratosphaeriaceae sp. CCFEE 6253]